MSYDSFIPYEDYLRAKGISRTSVAHKINHVRRVLAVHGDVPPTTEQFAAWETGLAPRARWDIRIAWKSYIEFMRSNGSALEPLPFRKKGRAKSLPPAAPAPAEGIPSAEVTAEAPDGSGISLDGTGELFEPVIADEIHLRKEG
jgi:hypothetical protein